MSRSFRSRVEAAARTGHRVQPLKSEPLESEPLEVRAARVEPLESQSVIVPETPVDSQSSQPPPPLSAGDERDRAVRQSWTRPAKGVEERWPRADVVETVASSSRGGQRAS